MAVNSVAFLSLKKKVFCICIHRAHSASHKTTEEKIKYTELNKTVKKKRRAKARRKRREFVLRILEGKKRAKRII